MRHHHPKVRPTVLFALIAALTVWGIPQLSSGQENLGRGRISGTVADENGEPVAGVKILAESLQGTAKLDGVSDKKGRFAIAGLGTGMWRITGRKEGYLDSIMEMDVSQLRVNPPVALTMKKITGLQELRADPGGLEIVDRGNALLEEEKFDEAIAAFREFQAKYPEVYQVRLNVATAHLKKGDLEQAEAEFKGALECVLQTHGDYLKDKITSVRGLSGLGELFLKKGEFEAGQKYFSEALKISPEDEAAAYNVGEIFFSNQKIDEAIQYFEMATKIKKDWSKPYYRLGFVYLNKGDFDKALENFKKFIELDPANPEVPNVRNVMAAVEKMKK